MVVIRLILNFCVGWFVMFWIFVLEKGCKIVLFVFWVKFFGFKILCGVVNFYVGKILGGIVVIGVVVVVGIGLF